MLHLQLGGILLLITSYLLADTSLRDNALNVPQLLLPYAASDLQPTKYTLRGLRGCFKWTSTKPSVATVTKVHSSCNGSTVELEDEDACSQSAIVTVTFKKKSAKQSTVILAEEESSGIILRCDVFVDYIDHIAIATTARELLIGESPEVFYISAYDKEGNVFSALGSTTFEWSITPLGSAEKAGQRTVLKMLWFHNSVYETTNEIYQLEKEGSRGHSILIEGVHTGDAMVGAKVIHPEYDNVVSEVKVTVFDNVLLIPLTEYILVDQIVHYSAYQLRRGKQNPIVLPSEQYSFKILDEEIGELDKANITVKGLALGVTYIHLIDNNMANYSSDRLPTSTLHVVNPAKIGFSIMPGKRWVLQVGSVYQIHVLLYDVDDNRIRIDDGTIFLSFLLEDYFDISFRSANGSYFICHAKKVGKTMINSTLEGVSYGEDLKPATNKIFGEQSIEIFDPITISPEHLTIPWDPALSGPEMYNYQLSANGGSGDYLWSTVDSGIASINKNGLVTGGNILGDTVVKVFDAKNQNHQASSKVSVLSPTAITFVLGKVEALVGETLSLGLNVANSLGDSQNLSYFGDCRKMKLQLSFSDSSIFKEVVMQDLVLPEEGCTSIALEAANVGDTLLTATYTYADVTLSDSIVIAGYKPLKVIDPFDFSLVTLGSTKKIIAEGGPSPWALDTSKYFQLMFAEEDTWVKISAASTKDNSMKVDHIFEVTCNSLGEQVLTINVFNKPTTKNKFPAESSTTTKFVCNPPVSLKLVPVITLPEIDGVKRTIESCVDSQKHIPVLNDRDLTVALHVFDANGNLFDDASSLKTDWTTDDVSVAEVSPGDVTVVARDRDEATKVNLGVQMSHVVRIHPKQAPVIVTAAIVSYSMDGKEEPIESAISANLPLLATPGPVITPNSVKMAIHHSNKVTLQVTGGTKEFVVKNSGFANVTYSASEGVNVVAIAEGEDKITLYDACLDSEKPAEGLVSLHIISSVELLAADKVEVGKSIVAKCSAFDQDGNILSISNSALKELNLDLKLSLDIAAVERKATQQNTEVSYMVTGNDVGETKLSCLGILEDGIEILSNVVDLQVFSPIQLNPKSLTLLVGSTYQLQSHGGPRPHCATVYSCGNETVLQVNSLGLVTTTNIGETLVTGQAKRDATVYSQDETIINVIQLKGFKIVLQSRNLVTNSEVGVHCVGISDEGPFTFGTSTPHLKFVWKSSDPKAIDVESIHHKAGVSLEDDQDFRAVLRVKSPGQATISLEVQVASDDFSQVSEDAALQDEIQVQIFDKLEVLNPKSGKLLIPVNNVASIQTNKDQLKVVSYTILPSCASCAGKVDDIIQLSETGDVNSLLTGTANVLVTSEEYGFSQTALVQVEVKTIASITLISNSLFVISDTEHPSFPIGSTAEFSVTLHDSMARQFDISSIPLLHILPRSDIVQVLPSADGSKFNIACNNIGETILKVQAKENPLIVDYVRLTVAEGIVPSKASVVLGGAICLSPRAVLKVGTWNIGSNVLSGNVQTGVFVGTAVGTTAVQFNSDSYSTYGEVEVVSHLEPPAFDETSPQVITNAVNNHIFYITIASDASCAEGTSVSLEDSTLPISCSASWQNEQDLPLASVLEVKAIYSNNRFACSVTTVALTPEVEISLASVSNSISLVAKMNDGTLSSVSVPFIPKFHVDVTSIVLGPEDVLKELNLLGSSADLDTLVISSEFSAVAIEKSGSQVKISLQEVLTSDVETSVTITSSITKHTVSIPIKIIGKVVIPVEEPEVKEEEEPSPPAWSLLLSENSIWVLTNTLAIAIIIIILIFYPFVKKKQPPKPVLVPPPVTQSPYTPRTVGNSPFANKSPYSGRTTLFSVQQ